MLKMVHKRKSKKKDSKEGVILITVLFILAMAMIFITSAILLTSGTRSRLYTRAEENQSRLTVTSVAESFYAAIEMHEINKGMVTSLDGFGPINVTAAGVPGMSGTADDCTTIEVNKDISTGYYNVDIVTKIGTQSDTVRLVLEPNEEQHFGGGGFGHQVEVVGGGQLANVSIGYDVNSGGRYNSSDNTILSRGTAGTPIGSTNMYSTFITTGAFAAASGSKFFSDVVIWGADGTLNAPAFNGSGFEMMDPNTGIFFINNNAPITGYNGSSTLCQNSGANIVVSGTNANFDAGFGNPSQALGHANGHIYTANGGTATASGVVQAAVTSAVSQVQDNLTRYGSSTFIPNQEESGEIYYWQQCANKNHLDVNANGGTALNIASCSTSLPAGEYKVSGGLSGRTITCDLSTGDYIFYLPNGLYMGNNGIIELLNSDGVHHAVFVIGAGKKLEIQSDAMAGIIDGAVYGVDSSTPAADRRAAYAANGNKPDQSVMPAAYVYGAGMDTSHSTQIYMNGNQGSYLTAYCALYPTTADSNDAGSFHFYNSSGKFFYGRVNAYTVLSETGGLAPIPYCPAPHADEDPDAFIPIKPDYNVVALEYYYAT